MTHLIAAAGAPRVFASIRNPNYQHPLCYPVIAWDTDGFPWVALDEAKHLVPATRVQGYCGLSMTSDFDGPMAPAQIIPAQPGWTIQGQFWDGEENEIAEPIVAWALDHRGVARPMVDDGGYLVVRHELDGRPPYQIVPPEAEAVRKVEAVR